MLSAPAAAQANVARTCNPGNNVASQQLAQGASRDNALFSDVPADARFVFVARQNGGPSNVQRSGARFSQTSGTYFQNLVVTLGLFGRGGAGSATRIAPTGGATGQSANFRIDITGTGAPRRTAWSITCLDDGPTVTRPADQTVDPFTSVSVSVTAEEPNDPDPVATYAWTAPADISLVDADTPNPSFLAPFIAPGTGPRTILMELTVTDDDGDQVTTSTNVTINEADLDLSDGPSTYQDTGHVFDSAIRLGAAIDIDATLQASPNADGDGADDDGITIPALTQRKSGEITADVVGVGGFLQGWIDFDGSGTFEANEQIAADLQDGGAGDTNPNAGAITINFSVPSDATLTQTVARFRWSTQSGLDSVGIAPDGEVEDYAVTILPDPLAGLPPFMCSGEFFQVHGTPNSSVSRVDLATGNFNTIANSGANVRATGLDPDSLYAYSIQTQGGGTAGNVLFAIGSNGQAVNLGTISGLVARNYPSGDFGPGGLFYIRNNGSNRPLIGIDVEKLEVESQHTPTGLSNNPNTADFAFNPVDQSFYAVESNSTNARLFRFTLNAGTTFTVESVGATGISTRGNNGNNVFGAMYADSSGNVFGIQNSTGRLHQFNTTDGTAVIVGQAAQSAQNDGFSCSEVETVIPRDFGDAPADGTVIDGITTNYGAASQARDPGDLFIGVAAPTAEENNANPTDNADGDANDEAVLETAVQGGTTYSLALSVRNNTGGDAFLCGFLDAGTAGAGFDGMFDAASERVCAIVPTSNANQSVDLNWTGLDFGTNSTTFLRLRLATVQREAEAATGEGASIGEVEDYSVSIAAPPAACPVGFYETIDGQLALFNTATETYTSLGPDHEEYNGTGFNVNDGFIYGIGNEGGIRGRLVRTDIDGNLADLGSAGFASSAAGDMDRNNNLYARPTADSVGVVDVLNVTSATLNYDNTNGDLAGVLDMVFFPDGLQGQLIGVRDGALRILDLNTLVAREVAVPDLPNGGYGAAWTTNDGALYASRNSTGTIYRILDPLTATPTIDATFRAAPGTSHDGASCPLAPPPSFQPGRDSSDAPISGTGFGKASHIVVSGIQLGARIDVDSDDIISADADGDGADDDGIMIPALALGETATITGEVTGAGGFLQGWIDFDSSGTFEASEQIAANLQDDGAGGDGAAVDGIITFDVTVPADATTDQTFARFRWSTTSGLNTMDPAPDGEVEDYAVTIMPSEAVDLELDLSFEPATNLTVGVTHNVILALSNVSASNPASGVEVNFPIPTGYAISEVFEAEANSGTGLFEPVVAANWDETTGVLVVGDVAATDTVHYIMRLAPLNVTASAIAAEVRGADQLDLDSLPNNGVGNGEDDEASLSPTIGTGLQLGQCAALPVTALNNASITANNEYVLTEDVNNQNGFIWSNDFIDLNEPFDVEMAVFLGSNDSVPTPSALDQGADGMSFILHNDPRGTGAQGLIGGFLGVDGQGNAGITFGPPRISPSLTVEFDTFDNAFTGFQNEIAQDHTSIVLDGDVALPDPDNLLLPATPINGGQIEDGLYHNARYIWSPTTQTLTYFFDGELVGTVTRDLVDYFGSPFVRFGFAAATGGSRNRHSACWTRPPDLVGGATQVSGNVFGDADYNTALDSGEDGLENITVSAFLAGDDSIFGTADDSLIESVETLGGAYSFALSGGDYQIRVDAADPDLPADFLPTGSTIVGISVSTGDSLSDIDFGFAAGADLELGLTTNTPSAGTGDEVSFTLTVSNTGSALASNIEVSALLPAELDFVFDSSGGTVGTPVDFDPVTGLWTIASLGPNTQTQLLVTATAKVTGTITYVTEISSVDQPDPDSVPGIADTNGILIDDGLDADANFEDDDEASVEVELIERLQVSGRVFFDNGVGSAATAHNGLIEGDEQGAGDATVVAVDVVTANVLGSVVTAGDGTFDLNLPPEQDGRETRLQIVTSPDALIISSSPGSASVSVDPADRSLIFTPAVGVPQTGLNFGLAQLPRLVLDQEQSIQSGGVAVFSHRFITGAPVEASFAIINEESATLANFTTTLFGDTDCSGSLDAGETPVTSPQIVAPNQEVCLLVRVANATGSVEGEDIQFELVASGTYANTPETFALENLDRVTVGARAALQLTKTVCNTSSGSCDVLTGVGFDRSNSGAPGDTLIYRLTFENRGAGIIDDVSVSDDTPAFSSLTATPPGVVISPQSLTCTLTAPTGPAAGFEGGLEWICPGEMQAGSVGVVTFEVRIAD